MGSFQVCDALNIFFELEKPHVEHLEGFILLPKEGGKLQKISKFLIGNSNSRIRKNSPIGSAKVGASMVGGMFAIIAMSCWGEMFTKVNTRFRLLGTVPWCTMAACSTACEVIAMAMAEVGSGTWVMPKSLENVAHRHPMPHIAHNGPIVWMQTPWCN